jgi:hypothetical protein
VLQFSMGARKRTGIGLSYRPARLHRLAESIPGLPKSLKIQSLGAINGAHPFPRNTDSLTT